MTDKQKRMKWEFKSELPNNDKSSKGKIIDNGHTMFLEDVVIRLNYLEQELATLQADSTREAEVLEGVDDMDCISHEQADSTEKDCDECASLESIPDGSCVTCTPKAPKDDIEPMKKIDIDFSFLD